jgi:hypothetical protein
MQDGIDHLSGFYSWTRPTDNTPDIFSRVSLPRSTGCQHDFPAKPKFLFPLARSIWCPLAGSINTWCPQPYLLEQLGVHSLDQFLLNSIPACSINSVFTLSDQSIIGAGGLLDQSIRCPLATSTNSWCLRSRLLDQFLLNSMPTSLINLAPTCIINSVSTRLINFWSTLCLLTRYAWCSLAESINSWFLLVQSTRYLLAQRTSDRRSAWSPYKILITTNSASRTQINEQNRRHQELNEYSPVKGRIGTNM